MVADKSSIFINCFGILLWIFIWSRCDLFTKVGSIPFLEYMFFVLITILLLNLYNSDSSEGTYDEEVRKLNGVETHAKTLCTLVITVSLCTRMMSHSLDSKVISTFYYLMILATISTSIVLFDYSTPKDASKIRQLRKIESIFVNYATIFTIMSVIFVSFHMIEYNSICKRDQWMNTIVHFFLLPWDQ